MQSNLSLFEKITLHTRELSSIIHLTQISIRDLLYLLCFKLLRSVAFKKELLLCFKLLRSVSFMRWFSHRSNFSNFLHRSNFSRDALNYSSTKCNRPKHSVFIGSALLQANYSSKRKLNLVQNTFQNHRKYFSKTLKLFIENSSKIHRKIKFKPLPRSTANLNQMQQVATSSCSKLSWNSQTEAAWSKAA